MKTAFVVNSELTAESTMLILKILVLKMYVRVYSVEGGTLPVIMSDGACGVITNINDLYREAQHASFPCILVDNSITVKGLLNAIRQFKV